MPFTDQSVFILIFTDAERFFLSTFEQHLRYESHVYALFGQSFAGKLVCILINKVIILNILLNALALYRCAFNHNLRPTRPH